MKSQAPLAGTPERQFLALHAGWLIGVAGGLVSVVVWKLMFQIDLRQMVYVTIIETIVTGYWAFRFIIDGQYHEFVSFSKETLFGTLPSWRTDSQAQEKLRKSRALAIATIAGLWIVQAGFLYLGVH